MERRAKQRGRKNLKCFLTDIQSKVEPEDKQVVCYYVCNDQLVSKTLSKQSNSSVLHCQRKGKTSVFEAGSTIIVGFASRGSIDSNVALSFASFCLWGGHGQGRSHLNHPHGNTRERELEIQLHSEACEKFHTKWSELVARDYTNISLLTSLHFLFQFFFK